MTLVLHRDGTLTLNGTDCSRVSRDEFDALDDKQRARLLTWAGAHNWTWGNQGPRSDLNKN